MQRKGFTLVELLVAVGIIGVLASVSVVSVNSVRQKGRDAKRISEVKQMQSALEGYFSSNSTYPVEGPTVLGSANNVTLCSDNTGFAAAGCANPFMQTVNRDPRNGAAVPGGNNAFYDYTYQSRNSAGDADCAAAPCASYSIQFYLESGTGSFRGGVLTTATPNGVIQ